MDKISIIIPVYNSEQYLRRCLDAALNQTYKNIEVICIDDCSRDGSQKILQEYKRIYKEKIVLIEHSENKGVSFSRNDGIRAAKGDYIVFCDSDDWYELDAIEKMHQKAKEENAEFVFSNYYLNKNEHRLKRNVISQYESNPISRREIVKYMDISSCAKMIRTSLIVSNSLYYPVDLRRCEEYSVIPVAAYLAKKVVALDEYTYNYFQNKGSASNKKEKRMDFFEKAFVRYLKYIDTKAYKNEIFFRAVEHLLYGKTLCMLKANYSSNDIKLWIDYFEKKYGKINKEILLQFGFSRKIFLFTVKRKFIFGLRILSKIHEIITG